MADPRKDSAEPEAVREQDGGGLNHPTPASESSRGNERPDAEGTGEVEHEMREIPGSGGVIAVEDSGIAAGDEIVQGADLKALHDRAS